MGLNNCLRLQLSAAVIDPTKNEGNKFITSKIGQQ